MICRVNAFGVRMRGDAGHRGRDEDFSARPCERRVLVASKAIVFASLAVAAFIIALRMLAPTVPFVNGTVRQVDAAGRTVTFEHDAIPNLCMESMVMMFEAKNSAMLAPLKVGDRVRFTADEIDNHPVITRIEKLRD